MNHLIRRTFSNFSTITYLRGSNRYNNYKNHNMSKVVELNLEVLKSVRLKKTVLTLFSSLKFLIKLKIGYLSLLILITKYSHLLYKDFRLKKCLDCLSKKFRYF